jgi:hypothetical protein
VVVEVDEQVDVAGVGAVGDAAEQARIARAGQL